MNSGPACRFLHCSDLHLGADRYNCPRRIEDFFEAFEWVLRVAAAEHVDFVLAAGDLFDRRQIQPVILQRTTEILRAFSPSIPVITTSGNHDRSLLTGHTTWMDYLCHEGLTIHLDMEPGESDTVGLRGWDSKRRRGAVLELPGARIVGLGYLGAAIKPKLEQVGKVLRSLPEKKPVIAMLHAGLLGGVHAVDGGVTVAELSPLIDCCDYIALGHAHSFHRGHAKVFTPGAVEAVDVGEADYERGVILAKLEANGSLDFQRIPYTGRPIIQRTLHLEPAACPSPAALPKLVKTLVDEQPAPADAIFHLRIRGAVPFDRFAVGIRTIREVIDTAVQPLLTLVDIDLTEPDSEEMEESDPERIERSVYESLASGNKCHLPAGELAAIAGRMQELLDAGPRVDELIAAARRFLKERAAEAS
ncbi:exonuclease SbcCD subunit D [bacterium]|nr:exonuclease SbcCD subunit D [candidate division CSSED10-310 bacterium]